MLYIICVYVHVEYKNIYTCSNSQVTHPPCQSCFVLTYQQVSTHYRYYTFGVLLLNDKMGNRVNIIEDECRGKPERIVMSILQGWLAGKGLPVTWKSLIKTLRDTDLSVLAEQIEATKI